MTGNPWFPSPRPDLATVESATEALDKAQTATLAGAQAETATRNDKRPRGARVWVRYRTIVKSVTSDWSQPLSIIVM